MSEREMLLERLLSGDADARDPAVQELFRRDPSAREEFEALRELEASLERQGDRARDLVAESNDLDVDSATQRVHEVVRALAERGAPPSRALRRGIDRGWLALAAAVLLAVVWGLWSQGDRYEPEIAMGPATTQPLAIVRPVHAVASYAPFEWIGALEAGHTFEVLVYDADAPGADPILESGPVTGRAWDPGDRAPTTWPARIQWMISRYDTSRVRVERASAEASLLP